MFFVLNSSNMAGKHKPIGDGSADPGEDEERDAAGGGQTEHGASHSILQGFVKISRGDGGGGGGG